VTGTTGELPRICVVGLGYIGLPTASLLASKGYEVRGVDVSREVVETIQAGHIHIREPELDVLVKSAVQSGYLTAVVEPALADVFILAVPTPFMDGNKPDLSYVEQATRRVAAELRGGELVILESTSPVGTTENVARWLVAERPDLTIPEGGAEESDDVAVKVAHCPERVLPGHILRELVENDRIVGGVNPVSTRAAVAFYEQFVSGRVLPTDARAAELAKLVENTFRDVNIALANELSLVCDHVGVDVWEVIELANHHPRVNLLRPGPGVGGHCLAVDPWFIVDSAPKHSRLIRMAREVNNAKPEWVVQKVREKAERLRSPIIACLGLAYKADVDDLRESPALAITRAVAQAKLGRILTVEPNIETIPDELAASGVEAASLEEAVRYADIVVGLVNHRAFRQLPRSALDEKVVIDVPGMWR